MTGVTQRFWRVILFFGVKIGLILFFSKKNLPLPLIINWLLPQRLYTEHAECGKLKFPTTCLHRVNTKLRSRCDMMQLPWYDLHFCVIQVVMWHQSCDTGDVTSMKWQPQCDIQDITLMMWYPWWIQKYKRVIANSCPHDFMTRHPGFVYTTQSQCCIWTAHTTQHRVAVFAVVWKTKDKSSQFKYVKGISGSYWYR